MMPALLLLLALTPPPEYTGHWVGETRSIVTFMQRKTLRLDLTIHADGAVTGTVGDARITKSSFRRHNWVERRFGNRGYVLRVELDGDLVKAEGIRRGGAHIMVRTEGDALVGRMNSFGTKGLPAMTGHNRRHMMVTCVDLRLRRAP